MKIVQLTSSLSRNAGGPFVSIRRQAQELVHLGCQVYALGVDDDYTQDDLPFWEPVQAYPQHSPCFRFYYYAPGLRRQLATLKPVLVHSHGLWLYHQLVAYRYAARTGIPLIVSPRGMLAPRAFTINRYKKLPLWWLYERRGLQAASVLHATSLQEASGFRAMGLTAPIAIIPNGVDLPECIDPRTGGRKTALFLSRIHRIKGLLNLVEAWRVVRPEGWRVIIAGPSADNHEMEVRAAVQQAGLGDCFEFVGPVYGEKKSSLYREADLFLLPSYSENFGNAVAEALAHGVPVITTTGAPWSDLRDHDCGWWIDVGVPSLSEALRAATSLSSEELRAMGMRGRRLVEVRYSWPSVAMEMKKVYEWVTGVGRQPDSVRLY